MPALDAIQQRLANARHIDRSLNYGRHIIRDFLRRTLDANDANNSTPLIADLGAGHGDDLRIAHDLYPDARLHAIEAMDYHASLLENQPDARPALIVHRLDIERHALPFENESADAIIANQILEHTKELFWILHESARVLRVGGAIIVGVPNLASLHNRLLLLTGRQPTSILLDSAHVRGLTRQGLRRLLAAAAPAILRIEAFAGSNFYPLPEWAARPAARLMPGLAVSAFFLVRKRAPYANQILDYVRSSRFETNYRVTADPPSVPRS
ncbi:MAG: class I SAM-dependent methyltransferase [Phycisphaeraceae bacterium]|nr:class I SAM-dependent methyltransferase [Phycisphaeraceae bacterium]